MDISLCKEEDCGDGGANVLQGVGARGGGRVGTWMRRARWLRYRI